MTTAVDSSVILDVLTGDRTHAESSLSALRRASQDGRLVVGECVVAEIRPVFSSPGAFEEFLRDWGLDFVPSSLQSAKRAGEMLRLFLTRRKKREGPILPDFLIGAHARACADRLLARDRGFLRDYFSDLKVWDPSSGGTAAP